MSNNWLKNSLLLLVLIIFSFLISPILPAQDHLERILQSISKADLQVTSNKYYVRDYGAVGDGITNDQNAIQIAIDLAHSAGGGDVIFDQGKTYCTGNFFLKSGVSLVIDPDSRILASRYWTDYSPTPLCTEDEEGNCVCQKGGFPPFIFANVSENICIKGGGTIEGPDQKMCSSKGKLIYFESTANGPYIIFFNETSNATIENIKIEKSGTWTIIIEESDHVVIDSVTIRNRLEGRQCNDGIDICNSQYVTVQNCDIETNDDNIVLKGKYYIHDGIEYYGLTSRIATDDGQQEQLYNIIIQNNKVYAANGGWGLKIGDILNTRVSHVWWKNNIIRKGNGAGDVSIRPATCIIEGVSYVHNIYFDNTKYTDGNPVTYVWIRTPSFNCQYYEIYWNGEHTSARYNFVKTTDECETSNYASISGNVHYYDSYAPVWDSILEISQESMTEYTDSSGYYKFIDLVINKNYTVKISKPTNTDIGNHNISCYDAALTAQASVGIYALTNYQTIAADADKDGQISTFDAALIARYAVGLSKLSVSYVADWKFVPDSLYYQPLDSVMLNQNFIGIIIGNVHGGWSHPGVPKKGKVRYKKYKHLTDIITFPGEEIIVPLITERGQKIVSADINFTYDPGVLQFLEVAKTELSDKVQVVFNDESGKLRVGAYSINSINKEGILLNLKFKVTGQAGKVSSLILDKYQLNNTVFMNGEALLTVKERSELPTRFALHPNYPNPFNSLTTIQYELPYDVHVTLKVYNISGREIATLVEMQKEAGYHQITWNGKNKYGNLVSGGIYIISFIVRNHLLIKKMLLIK